jgi:hypothetical protein
MELNHKALPLQRLPSALVKTPAPDQIFHEVLSHSVESGDCGHRCGTIAVLLQTFRFSWVDEITVIFSKPHLCDGFIV